jgi:signal transduction histidine kinase/ligand-binding sensor domain-containing protein
MSQQHFWVAYLHTAVLLTAAPLGMAAEPVLTTDLLRDWSFTPLAAGAGEHPVVELTDGGIVVGHAGGLRRFDGHRMIPLDIPAGSAPVKHLLSDRMGSLHIVLADGTHAVRSEQGLRFITDAGPPPDFSEKDAPEPLSICEAGDGSVWVGYRQGLVSRTVGLQRTWHPIPAGESASPDNSAYVAADIAGRVWLARRTRLAVWPGGGWRVEQDLPDQQTIVAAARSGGLWVRVGNRVHHFDGSRFTQAFDADVLTIRGFVEDHEGRLWIATTRYGLVMWDGSRLATAETASSSIYSVCVDRHGGIWAGTTAGLERGVPRIVQRVEMPTLKPLRTICCDTTGRLWFLTLDGEVGSQPGPLGPWLRSGGRGTTDTVFHSRLDGWRYGRVTALTISPRDIVWLGTQDGGIVRIDQTDAAGSENLSTPPELRGQPVTAILALGDGLLVAIGTSLVWLQDDQWHPIDWPPDQPAAAVRLMVGDGGRAAYVATESAGLFRLLIAPEASRSTATVTPIPQPAAVLAPITAIVPQPDSSVWIATRGEGLWRYHDAVWTQLTLNQGLPAETLLAVVPDGRGRLWCTTPRLFFTAMIDELNAVATGCSDRCHCWVVTRDDRTAYFDPTVVLPGIATSDGDGTIMVALPTGIAASLTDRLPAGSPPQPVRISGLQIDGQLLQFGGTTPQVPADPRLVEIFLGETILPTPTNARLEHRLVGIDRDWLETPADRRLVYERLPSGRHPLELRSRNEAGTWTSTMPAAVLEIAPTWWERPAVRWAAIFAVALTAAGGTFWLHSRRTSARLAGLRQQALLDQERMRIARDMHDDLGTSLTQISLLADLAGRSATAETAESLRQISQIACTTVSAFDEIVWAVNPEHDTLQHLLGYLALSASQTLASLGIGCNCDLPSQVPLRATPAEFRRGVLLCVKEAINNIVKHAGAAQVAICCRVTAGRLIVTIADDGCGAAADHDSRPRPAAGLENMHHRAAELGGTCSVAALPGGGTEMTLDVPLPAAGRLASRPSQHPEPSHAT